MAEKKGLDLPQTRGFFQLQGIATGTEKDKFSQETLTKESKKPFRMVNFGVQTDKESTVYVNLNGGELNEVYFSKTETINNKKVTETQKVAWKDRFTFKKDKYRMIGVNVGVKKKVDEKGKTVNDKKILTPYDACKEIGDNLKDDQSLFVKGTIDYSHFSNNNGETKNSVKFIPTQISLCQDVNFDEKDFKPMSQFTQTILFMDIKQDENDKERFIVFAKIVGYNAIEDAEFIITNKNLALQFKKNLKPYHSITVVGDIHMQKNVEEVSTEDYWGEKNDMNKINAPTIRELIITGADPSSIDKETYTEEKLDEALAKINANKKADKDFGKDDWGNANLSSKNTDDDEAWS